LCGFARAVLQRLEDLADRAAVVIGGPGGGRDWRGLDISPTTRKVGATVRRQGASCKVLGIINFRQTQRVGPSLVGLAPQVLIGLFNPLVSSWVGSLAQP